MIKDRLSISEKFEDFTRKPTSKSISALLKLDLTMMNHPLVKNHNKNKIKRKNTLFFFTQVFVAPTRNHTTCKYSLP
jgi:hypothetical protein